MDYVLSLQSTPFKTVTVTSLSQFVVYGHTFALVMTHGETCLKFAVTNPRSMRRVCVGETMHSMTMKALRKRQNEVGARKPKTNTQAALVIYIVTFLGHAETDERKRTIARAEAIHQKRVDARERGKAAAASKHEASSESDDDAAAGGEDVEKPPMRAGELLRKIAPMEMDFVLGKASAAMGLNEEEDDVSFPAVDAVKPVYHKGKASGRSSGKGTTTRMASRAVSGRVARDTSSSSPSPPHSPKATPTPARPPTFIAAVTPPA